MMMQQINTKLDNLGLRYDYSSQLGLNRVRNKLPKLANNSGSGLPLWTTNTNGDLVAGLCEEDAGCSTLRSELITKTSGSDGASIVGLYDSTNLLETDVSTAVNSLIASVGDSVPTGIMAPTIQTSALSGWVRIESDATNENMKTVGSAASGATARANADCESLFEFLWDEGGQNTLRFPIYTSAGVLTTYGGSAAADWSADKRISLPNITGKCFGAAGRNYFKETFTADASTDELTVTSATDIYYPGLEVTVSSTGTLPGGLSASTSYYVITVSSTLIKLATTRANVHSSTAINITSTGTGTHSIHITFSSFTNGAWAGEETHLLLEAEMAPHKHNAGSPKNDPIHDLYGYDTIGSNVKGQQETSGLSADRYSYTSDTGGNDLHNIIQPTFFCEWYIKL